MFAKMLGHGFVVGLLVHAAAVGSIAVGTAQDAPQTLGNAKVKALLKERLALLRTLEDDARKAYRNGEGSLEQVHHAQLAVFKAELDLCESAKERVAVLEKILKAAKDYEAEAVKAVATGTIRPSVTIKAKVARLEAEIALERAKGKDDHAHGHGPHGGVVFDLGKYNAEFTVDHDKKECMVFILGPDEKTLAAVACKELTLTTKQTKTKDGKVVPAMTIKLLPRDAKDGKASRFVGTDPGLANVADFEGTVSGLIEGKASQGQFKE